MYGSRSPASIGGVGIIPGSANKARQSRACLSALAIRTGSSRCRKHGNSWCTAEAKGAQRKFASALRGGCLGLRRLIRGFLSHVASWKEAHPLSLPRSRASQTKARAESALALQRRRLSIGAARI